MSLAVRVLIALVAGFGAGLVASTFGAATAGPIAEVNGAKMDEDVIALLDDYVGPTRQAKADAIAKARSEAAAYASTLGLRKASIVRISGVT